MYIKTLDSLNVWYIVLKRADLLISRVSRSIVIFNDFLIPWKFILCVRP